MSGEAGTRRRTEAGGRRPKHGTEAGGRQLPRVPALIRVRMARDLMDRRYADPLDLDTMAREAGFSRFHFARLFRSAYGETPGAYLSRRRVERAMDLLRAADVTVTEVCALVGFASLGSFSSRFRGLVGVSPSEYRRRHWERCAPLPVPGCFVMAWSRPITRPAGTEQSRRSDPSGGAVSVAM